ncbi:MAG: hypothetical protein ACK4WF_02895, partial [Candidatus Brocadiales bacterium]
DEHVGFTFNSSSASEMISTIKRGLELYGNPTHWTELMRHGMLQDWSWDKSAREYVELYQKGVQRLKGSRA